MKPTQSCTYRSKVFTLVAALHPAPARLILSLEDHANGEIYEREYNEEHIGGPISMMVELEDIF